MNTTIAYCDNYSASQEIYSKNNLTYVNKGKTVIKINYPFCLEGTIISVSALVITAVFLILTKRKHVKGCVFLDIGMLLA